MIFFEKKTRSDSSSEKLPNRETADRYLEWRYLLSFVRFYGGMDGESFDLMDEVIVF